MSLWMTVRRWLPVFGGALVQLTLGTLYCFGNLNPYMTSYLRHQGTPADLSYSSSVWVFALTLGGQGFAVFLGGILEKRIGPRWTVLAGAWLMSLGVMMTYFSIKNSFITMLVTYGFLFGIGIGIAYPASLSCAMKWHPHRKGLVNGMVVAGFGLGAFVFNQVQTAYINPNNVSPTLVVNGDRYFDDEDVLGRVPTCFLIMGGIYAGLQLFGCMLIRDPPEEREGLMDLSLQEDMEAINADVDDTESLHPCQVIRKKSFYILWTILLVNGETVSFISSLYKAYGETFISDDKFLALVGAFSSICNSFGRILWGIAGDKFSFRVTMMTLCSLLTFFMLTLIVTPFGEGPMFFIWICCIFLTFSGNFALFPTIAAKAFGQKYVGANFGLIFTSQAVAGPVGAILSSTLKDTLGWFGMFCLSGGFSFIGLICAFTFNVKKADGSDI